MLAWLGILTGVLACSGPLNLVELTSKPNLQVPHPPLESIRVQLEGDAR